MWEIRVKNPDRVDRLLRSSNISGFEWVSRQAWEAWFSEGTIRVNGRPVQKGALLKEGDLIEIPERELGLLPAETPAKCVYANRAYGIFLKDPGVATAPLLPWVRDSLANQIACYLEANGPISAAEFAALAELPLLEGGLVQRLDTDTSGLVCAAFTSQQKSLFRKVFSAHELEKSYLAIVRGDASTLEGTHELFFAAPKGGKTRVVSYGDDAAELTIHVRESTQAASLIEVTTTRGIRHIVRAGLAHLGHPLLGDKEYGDGEGAPYHQLHAFRLRLLSQDFEFPDGLEVDPPESFQNTWLTAKGKGYTR